MKNTGGILIGLVLPLVVGSYAGIGDGVRTVNGDWYSYSRSYLQHATKQGVLPTLVRGSAFNGSSAESFTTQVLKEVNGRPLGVGPLSFDAMPAGAAKLALFIAMVFDPAPGFDSYAACDPAQADQAGGAPRPETDRCSWSRPFAAASGSSAVG